MSTVYVTVSENIYRAKGEVHAVHRLRFNMIIWDKDAIRVKGTCACFRSLENKLCRHGQVCLHFGKDEI